MHMVNYKGVLADKEAPAYTKELVRVIQNKGGTTVGTWLQSVSTIDLTSISMGSDVFNSRNPVTALHIDYFVLLMNLLSSAEGLEISESQNSYLMRIKLLSSFVGFELMKRKGVDIKIYYENMTLNEDFSDATAQGPIIEKGPNVEKQLLEIIQKKYPTGLAKGLDGISEEELLEEDKLMEEEAEYWISQYPPPTLTRWAKFKNWIISKLE